ncbi:MAG: hypothetical protein C5B50_01110 [Verrucomicrobia bacterium]|nr:MAG: hypothetical protein C5B50_01110 [Verrucomicrobiota bacterium]
MGYNVTLGKFARFAKTFMHSSTDKPKILNGDEAVPDSDPGLESPVNRQAGKPALQLTCVCACT